MAIDAASNTTGVDERDARGRINDLERRIVDMDRSAFITNRLMLLALGSLVGSSPIKTQRAIAFILRSSSFAKPSGSDPSAVDLVGEEKAAQIIDGIERLADVFRDLRRRPEINRVIMRRVAAQRLPLAPPQPMHSAPLPVFAPLRYAERCCRCLFMGEERK